MSIDPRDGAWMRCYSPGGPADMGTSSDATPRNKDVLFHWIGWLPGAGVPVKVEAPAAVLLPTRYASDEGDAMSSPALSDHRASVPRTPPPPPGAGDRAAAPAGVAARYRYARRTSSWWWSPEMFAVQGLRPDAATPGTEALLRHQHPEDRARTLAAITAACEEARGFSLETRFTRPDGAHRAFVFVGEPTLDRDGHVVAVD